MKRTPEATIGWTVEDAAGRERDVTLTFALHSGEKADHWSPGYPPEQELVGATFDDDGSEVPDGLIDEDRLQELGAEAAERWDEADAMAREDAAIARAEARRERQYD